MTNSESIIINGLIDSRLEIAWQRLDENTVYQEQCRQQKISGQAAEGLLNKLAKAERLTIRRHYEGETAKNSLELNEAYIQGLRDCLNALILLGAFSAGVRL